MHKNVTQTVQIQGTVKPACQTISTDSEGIMKRYSLRYIPNTPCRYSTSPSHCNWGWGMGLTNMFEQLGSFEHDTGEQNNYIYGVLGVNTSS